MDTRQVHLPANRLNTLIKENLALQETMMALLWRFPYNSRQRLLRALAPGAYKRFQGMRKIETEKGRSLKPFDDKQCIFVK